MPPQAPRILFHAAPAVWAEYREVLPSALSQAGVSGAELAPDIPAQEADFIVYAPARGAALDLADCPRLRAVLSLWAGVETVVADVPPDIPLARMVDDDMTAGMVEYVLGHVMRHHLGMDAHIVNPDHDWRPAAPPLAQDRRVTVLGLGALGSAVAATLSGVGFRVSGWSRRQRSLPGIVTHAGPDGLTDALRGADIVVLLLPHTAQTENTLNATTLSLLAPGGVVINPGRGALIDDAALLGALDSGQVGHATLDAFRVEPLPGDHPYWAHPRVTVTPHVASHTRPSTAVRVIAENVRRSLADEPLLHLVDRGAGY